VGGSVDPRLLCRSWLRSRSEDTDTEEVYRPVGFPFPRRERGRAGYQFNADGTVKRVGIGATDGPRVATGVWQVDEENADRLRIAVEGPPYLLEIADLTPDRLAIRRGAAPGSP